MSIIVTLTWQLMSFEGPMSTKLQKKPYAWRGNCRLPLACVTYITSRHSRMASLCDNNTSMNLSTQSQRWHIPTSLTDMRIYPVNKYVISNSRLWECRIECQIPIIEHSMWSWCVCNSYSSSSVFVTALVVSFCEGQSNAGERSTTSALPTSHISVVYASLCFWFVPLSSVWSWGVKVHCRA